MEGIERKGGRKEARERGREGRGEGRGGMRVSKEGREGETVGEEKDKIVRRGGREQTDSHM